MAAKPSDEDAVAALREAAVPLEGIDDAATVNLPLGNVIL